MGHVARMEGERQAIQAMDWSLKGKHRRGRPQKNWQETICEDIWCMDMTWKKVIDLVGWQSGMEVLRYPMCTLAQEGLSIKYWVLKLNFFAP